VHVPSPTSGFDATAAASSQQQVPAPITGIAAPVTDATQQLLALVQQQQLLLQQVMSNQGERKKKDPPVYEGKFSEDLELWIFSTEEYYSNRRYLMVDNSSEFVRMISSNLGKTVMNWYRTFSLQCDSEGIEKTWELFKKRLRERFRPKDFEYNLRERLFHLKQTGSIHEYVSRFQDLMSQSELDISEMEKRFYFQNGLRAETEKQIKEEGPSYLQEVIEIASNFEFAHYTGKPVKSSIAAVSAANPKAKTPVQKQQGSSNKSAKKINSSQDWKKNAICHSCQKKGHIAPECPNRPKKEANHYVSGSFYAILEVQAEAFSNEANRQEVSIFIDNGCSLNGISEELAIQLRLTVCEDTNSLMEVDLGFGQTVLRPRRTASMNLQIPGFPATRGAFQVMPIPEGKDIILGMMWLREHNPIINWETLELSPREREPQSDTMPLVLPTKRPARKIGG
jgi:hypothetical protein